MLLSDLYEDMHSSALMRWFAGSKVVDADGRPKRMYHGTGAGHIDAFAAEKSNTEALFGPGFYFTESPEVAGGTGGGQDEEEINAKADWSAAGYAFQGRRYSVPALTKRQMAHAKRLLNSNYVYQCSVEDVGSCRLWNSGFKAFEAGEESFREWLMRHRPRWMLDRLKLVPERLSRPTVYPVYLRIIKPYEMQQPVGMAMVQRLWDISPAAKIGSFEKATAEFRGPSRLNNEPILGSEAWDWAVRWAFGSAGGPARVNQALLAMGYDGIHHVGGRLIVTMGTHDVWVAFSPNQIKSIFARQFDPDSADLAEDQIGGWGERQVEKRHSNQHSTTSNRQPANAAR